MPAVPPAFAQCPQVISCPGTDYPIANFSSEAPDQLVFCGMAWPSTVPALNSTWSSEGCFAVICSSVSQQDANIKAIAASKTCVAPDVTVSFTNGQWQATGCFGTVYADTREAVITLATDAASFCMLDPNYSGATLNGNPVPVFCNSPVTGLAVGADGSQFPYPVPGGIICGGNPDLVQAQAISYGNNQAQANLFWVDIDPSSGNPLHLSSL